MFVVADGMGGHDGGDVASAIVVEEFARLADHGYDRTRGAEVVHECLAASQRRIREYAEEHRAERRARLVRRHHRRRRAARARTTRARSGCWPTSATRGSTGSTTACLDQVSVDHSVVQELVDAGEIDAEDGGRPTRSGT